jgi:hypothetical protein
VDIRAHRNAFMALGAFCVLAPGIVLYALLRAVGVGVGAAGVLGLLTMFVGLFAFAAWAFRGLNRG